MRFVSFQLSLSRGASHERKAFLAERTLKSTRGLTLSAQFWADDTDEHRFEVVDERPSGQEHRLAACGARAAKEGGLVTLDLPLPPLQLRGLHKLHFELDGTRLSQSVVARVREVEVRGRRARYKGRGVLADELDRGSDRSPGDGWRGWPRHMQAGQDRARPAQSGAHLRNGEVFPIERPVPLDGALRGLWIAAYFAGFEPEQEGMHMFTVVDKQPDGTERLLAAHYRSISSDRVVMRLRLDPLEGTGPHRLDLAIDGRPAGALTVTF